MQIALHRGHHTLPFWHTPEQPTMIFDPAVHGKWLKAVRDESVTDKHVEKDIPVDSTAIWPILMGLHAVDLPMLAHVSTGFHEGRVNFFKRMWVQITTLPENQNTDGIPIVLDPDTKKIQVVGLWGGDNGTYSPRELEGAADASEAEYMSPEFWQQFFTTKLRETCQKDTEASRTAIRSAKRTLSLWGKYRSILR